MKTKLLGLIFCLFALGLTVAVRAEDLGAVKARMGQRASKVDAAKARGAAGENNSGFLEARPGATAEDNAVISAENKDRETVYAALAAEHKTSADQVGKTRARHIAEKSAPGVWVQGEDGSWKKK
jgi:uncharacterized protein YdbL (DUF1318 family)